MAQTTYGDNDGLGIARILPGWFRDLDAALKPIVSALAIIVITAPLFVMTIYFGREASSYEVQINDLIARGGATKAQVLTLTDSFEHALTVSRFGMVAMGIVAFVCAILTSYAISKLSTVWLRRLTEQTREVASGDLTVEIVRDNNSQIGDIQEALGKMVASFRATIRRIELAADDLRTASGEMTHISDEAGHAISEVAQSISSISEGAAHQVQLVTDTSNVVGEIEMSVRSAAEHSIEASRQSAATEALTEDGVRRATEIQEAMQSVRDTSVATSKMVRSLGEKSTNIDQIVRSITDIAAQTNLLALNAAIEAARAGEQGRGFAVVAEEVRKLAEEAQHSAGEIAQLIDEIRGQTDEAIVAMDAGVKTVEDGFDVVSRNRQAFFDISGAVRALNESSNEISALAVGIADDAGEVRGQIEEVASVAEESSASTEQVSASTQETSASAEEVAASASRVAQTAVNLAALAGRFKVGGAGKVMRFEKPLVSDQNDSSAELDEAHNESRRIGGAA